MPRMPRHRRAPGSLEPGQFYHVTNRGVERRAIFTSDLDRIVFLSLLAEACLTNGVVCHAFCLMSNHFHLVVEDPRGTLSQMMHHLGFCYARYFNDTYRRGGPLFESRFCAELIDSAAYFHDAVAYVLLNPVRTSAPMAPSAEAYRWSSAALVCAEASPAAFAATLLAPFGDVDAVLTALPQPRFKASYERRRNRLEALASGEWLERDRVLAGRSPELYSQVLAARVACEPGSAREQITRSIPLAAAIPPGVVDFVYARPRFTGLDLDEVLGAIVDACRAVVPASLVAGTCRFEEVIGYVCWRLTSAPAERIAAAVGMAADRFDDLLLEMRRNRLLDRAWYRMLWTVEWALRWQLRAAPHRP